MAKLLDRETAMGDAICNYDDEMGQSMLVQQEYKAIRCEEQQISNTTEEIDGWSNSMENRNKNGTNSRRSWDKIEEQNAEDYSININSNMAGGIARPTTEITAPETREYTYGLYGSRGTPRSRHWIQAKNKQSTRIIITNEQTGSWGTSCGHVNRGTSWLIVRMELTTDFSTWQAHAIAEDNFWLN